MTKTALVTGAAAGIGRVHPRYPHRRCTHVADEIIVAGGKAVALQASIADRAQVVGAVNKLRDALGPLTVLVNNSGVAEGPFYAYRHANTGFVLTGVGPRIDPDAHALDEDGRIIPGLFAAGQAGAGVLGERYVGGGNSVADAITMGRVAGMTIGRQVRKTNSFGKAD